MKIPTRYSPFCHSQMVTLFPTGLQFEQLQYTIRKMIKTMMMIIFCQKINHENTHQIFSSLQFSVGNPVSYRTTVTELMLEQLQYTIIMMIMTMMMRIATWLPFRCPMARGCTYCTGLITSNTQGLTHKWIRQTSDYLVKTMALCDTSQNNSLGIQTNWHHLYSFNLNRKLEETIAIYRPCIKYSLYYDTL